HVQTLAAHVRGRIADEKGGAGHHSLSHPRDGHHRSLRKPLRRNRTKGRLLCLSPMKPGPERSNEADGPGSSTNSANETGRARRGWKLSAISGRRRKSEICR